MLWHSWFSVVIGFICLSLKDGFDHKSLSLVITGEECCQWCVMKAGLLPTSLCVPSFPRAYPWLSYLNLSTHCSGLWVNSSRVGCSAWAIGGGGGELVKDTPAWLLQMQLLSSLFSWLPWALCGSWYPVVPLTLSLERSWNQPHLAGQESDALLVCFGLWAPLSIQACLLSVSQEFRKLSDPLRTFLFSTTVKIVYSLTSIHIFFSNWRFGERGLDPVCHFYPVFHAS